jgi:hypothetical protein
MKVIDILNALYDDENVGICENSSVYWKTRDEMPFKYLNREVDGLSVSLKQCAILVYLK